MPQAAWRDRPCRRLAPASAGASVLTGARGFARGRASGLATLGQAGGPTALRRCDVRNDAGAGATFGVWAGFGWMVWKAAPVPAVRLREAAPVPAGASLEYAAGLGAAV